MKHNFSKIIGIVLIALAIILNPWVLHALYSEYVFTGSIMLQIIFLELCLFVAGLVALKFNLIRKNVNRRNIAYCIFLIIILFIVAELTIGFVAPRQPYQIGSTRPPIPYIMFSNRPNYTNCLADLSMMGEIPEEEEECLSYNELGLRGDLPDRTKNDEFRIIVLGGSAAEGGNPLKNSIAKKLEKYLNEMGLENVRVYNWGVTSYNSAQELSLLLYYGIDYDPDMVIAYDGTNDLHQPFWYDPRPNYPYNFVSYEKAIRFFTNETNSLDAWDLTLLILRKSNVMEFVFQRFLKNEINNQFLGISQLRREVGYGSPEWEEEIIEHYINNIEKMSLLSIGADFKLAVFLQPMVNFKDPMLGNEPNLVSRLDFQMFVKRVYPEMGRRLENLSEKYPENNYYDYKDILNGINKSFFWDFVHVTNDGNDVIAKKMAEDLEPVIRDSLF